MKLTVKNITQSINDLRAIIGMMFLSSDGQAAVTLEPRDKSTLYLIMPVPI